jgi:DNA-binding beta-propeller fold protein YncE/uncharacterized membrane protein (GlpM family)
MLKRTVQRRVILATLILWLFSQFTVFADAPYITITRGPDGYFVGTQTAYEPDELITVPMNSPEDLFVDDATGKIYIADTGNARILVIDKNGNTYTIGEGTLANPSGIFVVDSKRIYVADYGNKKVYVFDEQGQLLMEIGKPTEPIYGKKNDFIPKKVAVDKRGNIYVISEGSINGVVQLNSDGNFVGYVGSNRTNMTFKMLLQRIFFTKQQKDQLFKSTPPSPTSIAIDQQGLLYTVTNGIEAQAIKKLNIIGNNVLPDDTLASPYLLDIDVDENGIIYTLDEYGYLFIYDSFGKILFIFGGTDEKYERFGFIKNPSAIDVDSNGKYIYVTDKERNVINRYRSTPFAEKVLFGVNQYKQGLYVESEAVWKEILRMNSFFILSYRALAKAYFKQNQHQKALESYKFAEDRQGYSDAFWQIRNEWLQRNAASLILLLIALLILRKVVRWLHNRYSLFAPIIRSWNSFKRKKLISELGFAFYFLRHPIDAIYELKENKRASLLSATILYIWLLFIQVAKIYVTGYLFSGDYLWGVKLSSILISTAVPLIFWIVIHYLVSTISDGEGRLSEVYIGTIYALTPYLLFSLPIALLSNLLTYNEAFLYDYSTWFIQAWSVVLMVIMVKELHNYTFKETLRNLFFTGFGIIIMALVLFILVLLFNQEVDFVRSIIQELRTRVY